MPLLPSSTAQAGPLPAVTPAALHPAQNTVSATATLRSNAAPLDAASHDQAMAERVANLYSFLPTTLAGTAAGALVLGMLFWNSAPRLIFVGWMSAFWLLWVLRVGTLARFDHLQPQDVPRLLFWNKVWIGTSLVSAALWGAATWLFYEHGSTNQRVGLLLTVYSFCVAAVPIFSAQRNAFNAFTLLCLAPMAARVGWPATPDNLMLAIVVIIIFCMTVLLARNYRMTLENVLHLKIRADQLMTQLRAEKAAADVARQQAEVANRAKTQFFAAASHDLRQPLHAMGLFAEALRQRSHDEEVVHLVNSINGSVDALEGLFSELLDITKIDTGGVETNPMHFNVGEIFSKLRLHFEPTAFEKGLALRFRGDKNNIYSDPILVERILRNLVSNAIRYTNDGTVLVSCRRREGKLLLQVWDSGVGIREREQERIFEEFYQVPYNESLSPQQRKGLGLGLAIVKRLADLIDAPLNLRSEVGRGTVFSLELAQGKAPRALGSASSGKAPIGLTLDHRFIVVVEDEPSVRGGLEVLLKGWGAYVMSFETVAATRAWAAAAEPDTPEPDLLVVDYRLEHGQTGLDALQVLRTHFNSQIPAIMVTGSTMTGHENDAEAHDFHLLVKPVVPNKLRAMIGFKLGVRTGA